jgi:hypothetical protein
MNLLDPNFLTVSVGFTAIMFAVIAFFTRAGIRRIVGALISAIPIIPLVLIYDTIAARLGWWHYPSFPTGHVPLAWYLAAALGYGAAFGLIGWRIIRRWAMPGLVTFIVFFIVFGIARDYAYSVTTQIIIFGHSPIPLLADLFSYASCAIIVQLLMRWIVGPAQSDTLTRMVKSRT